mgnify:CR=1 FL=1
MKSADIKKIRKKMEKTLDSARFEHTLGVTYTAACLAMRYDADITKAQIAGLLHDCAKCLTNEKRIFLCKKHNIQMNEAELKNPQLLHAKVGSFLAMEEFDIHDQDIINAILNHTTGRPDMSLLEKIIYIADYIEPNRREIPGLSKIRQIVFQNIDQAICLSSERTIRYLEDNGNKIDPMTIKTYEFYGGKL